MKILSTSTDDNVEWTFDNMDDVKASGFDQSSVDLALRGIYGVNSNNREAMLAYGIIREYTEFKGYWWSYVDNQ